MTIDLDDLEVRARHQLQGPCTGMAHEVLELIAELRVKNNLDEVNEWTEELEKNALRDELKRARSERDWLAEHIPNTVCPEGKSKCDDRTPTAGGTVGYACLLCWLKAARNAVEEQKP